MLPINYLIDAQSVEMPYWIFQCVVRAERFYVHYGMISPFICWEGGDQAH
jgi:hypothetical protein